MIKLTREEKHQVVLLIIAREGALWRSAEEYRLMGEAGVAESLMHQHDEVMALRKKFEPKERK